MTAQKFTVTKKDEFEFNWTKIFPAGSALCRFPVLVTFMDRGFYHASYLKLLLRFTQQEWDLLLHLSARSTSKRTTSWASHLFPTLAGQFETHQSCFYDEAQLQPRVFTCQLCTTCFEMMNSSMQMRECCLPQFE